MEQSFQEWTKQNLWKTAFKKFERVWSALGRPYPFKFFKVCLPQILLGPFLNTLSHMIIKWPRAGYTNHEDFQVLEFYCSFYTVKGLSVGWNR